MALTVEEVEAVLKLRDDMSRQLATAKTSLQNFGTTAGTTTSTTDRLGRSLLGLAAATLSVAAIRSAISSYAQFTSQIHDLSAKTGISTDALQRLKFAAEQNGASLDMVTRAVVLLGRNLAGGGDTAEGALNALGLSFASVRAMNPEQAFTTIADAIGRMPDPMARSKIAMDLFGRSGAELLPLMTGDLGELTAAADRLGIVLSEDVINAGDEFGDQLDVLRASGQAFIAQVLSPMIPGLTELARWLGTAIPAALAGARQGFDWLVRQGLEAQVAIREFVAGLAALTRAVPLVGERLGVSNETLRELSGGLQFAKDRLAAFEQQTRTTTQAHEAASPKIRTVNLDYEEHKKKLDDARKKAEEFKTEQDKLFGRDLIARALEMAEMLGDVSNVTRLTAEQKARLREAVLQALGAYRALKDENVSQKLRDIEAATRSVLEATHQWAYVALRAAVDATTPFEASVRDLTGVFEELRPAIRDSRDEIAAARERMEAARIASEDWREGLGRLASSLTQLAQVSGTAFGNVARQLATIITAMHAGEQAGAQIRQGFDQLGTSSRGTVAGLINMATGAIGAGAAMAQATATGSTFTRVLGGMSTGAAIGTSIFPGLGTAIGAAGGALVGFMRGAFGVSDAVRQVRTEVQQFQQNLAASLTEVQRQESGGEQWRAVIIRVRDALVAIGRSGEEALPLVEQLWDTDHPERARAAIAAINEILAQHQQVLGSNVEELGRLRQEQDALTQEARITWQAMQEAAERYGLDLAALGPAFQSARLHESAQTIWNDFILLTRGGADVGTVLSGMGDEISQLVRESIQFGTTIPENFRPLIEELLRSGQLIGADGQALTDLAGINFGDPIVARLDLVAQRLGEIADRIGQLITAIGADLPANFDRAARAGAGAAGIIERTWRDSADGINEAYEALDRFVEGASPGLLDVPAIAWAAGRSLTQAFDGATRSIYGSYAGLDDVVLLVGAKFPPLGDLLSDVWLRPLEESDIVLRQLKDGVSLFGDTVLHELPPIGDLFDDMVLRKLADAKHGFKDLGDIVLHEVPGGKPGAVPEKIPSFQAGGLVRDTGLGLLHAGETVLPAAARDDRKDVDISHMLSALRSIDRRLSLLPTAVRDAVLVSPR